MNIKPLTIAAIAAGALTVCSMAYADQFNNGFIPAGFYAGLQGGYGETDYGDNFLHAFNAANGSVDEDGIAGRGYVGYQFNPYIGVESGYTRFSDNTYRINYSDSAGNAAHVDTKFETQQVDALLKVGMPFGCSGFRGDLKGGAAYIMSDASADVSASSSSQSAAETVSKSEDTLVPAAGASLSYNFNKNLAADVSYLHAFGKSKLDSPSTDFVSLGLSYHFA